MSSNKMTQDDKARIQSSQQTGRKDMSSSGFAARAQSGADRNTNAGYTGSGQAGSGGNGGEKGSGGSGSAGQKQK